MGRDRKLDRKPLRRPTKNLCERRRRDKTQKKRLIALGIPEATTKKMTTRQIRQMLRKPAKIRKPV
jgi:hypothetical protein